MIREIWDTLTKEGKRSLLRSVAGFVLYALFGAAMILLMLNGLMAVFVEGVVPRAYPWLLCCCLLLKGSANMLSSKRAFCKAFCSQKPILLLFLLEYW